MIFFFVYLFVVIVANWFIHFIMGTIVIKKNVKVNYTRKINHFFLYLIPFLFRPLLPHNTSLWTGILASNMAIFILIIYIKPFRNRTNFLKTMFISFDRPEDRPHTFFWIISQYIFSSFSIMIGFILLDNISYGQLILIPIIIAALGDGLAEPIGIRFGKIKYQTFAIFTKKKYYRTLEGSFCVFLISLITVLFFARYFSPEELFVSILSIPLIMALTEAKSPHTWDQPFLNLVGSFFIFLIKILF